MSNLADSLDNDHHQNNHDIYEEHLDNHNYIFYFCYKNKQNI